MLKIYWLPTIKAAIELNANNSVQSLVFLEAAAPYELGAPPQFQLGTLYPAYIRGQAQLMAHDGSAAAAEFQKFLDHRGITINFPLGALAHLQLGSRMRCQEMRRKRKTPTKTSSRSGRTQTPTSPSGRKLRRSTRSCNELSGHGRVPRQEPERDRLIDLPAAAD